MKTLCFDIDGTICEQTESKYKEAKPYPEAIKVINALYQEGYRIIFYTSRFMGRNNGDIEKAYNEGYVFTKKQLDDWGFRYHKLIMGKPSHHLNIDDKSLFFELNWELIEKKIKDRVKEYIH
tara:strand:+ start:730 stop:1095 length:366 start_codon:yes stop_codon:yes gene_type:complete